MKRLVAIFLALALCVASFAADENAAVARLLGAIEEVEGVRDPARRGRDGELGFYRITPAAWLQHSQKPFELCATDRALERTVAEAHLDWLEANLRRARLIRANTTPRTRAYYLALAWNAGLSAVLRGHTTAPSRDYAQRVANLTLAP